MDSKEEYIEQYKKLKALNGGKKPLRTEFLRFCNVHDRNLAKFFGKDPYSKLQIECGDTVNKLSVERTPIEQILDQYGQLIRKHKRPPVSNDWIEADFYPRVDGLRKVHNLKWVDMQSTFIQRYANKVEWKDVLEILYQSKEATKPKKNEKLFDEIVSKLVDWSPNRKRILEEGYKIELRNYLNNYFDIEEEIGDTNVDLLINKKYPIEVKKDPTQSEYDRLLGQMIRHNYLYGSAIAVITNISSQDRFKKFQKLFNEVHSKLNMKAELINK